MAVQIFDRETCGLCAYPNLTPSGAIREVLSLINHFIETAGMDVAQLEDQDHELIQTVVGSFAELLFPWLPREVEAIELAVGTFFRDRNAILSISREVVWKEEDLFTLIASPVNFSGINPNQLQ